MLCNRLDGAAIIPQGLDPKVVEVYQAVGKIMSRFTAGKVPKAFKVIPNLQNWEEILFLTDPEKWSPHAVYQATRLFISNLNAKMVRIIVEACHGPTPPPLFQSIAKLSVKRANVFNQGCQQHESLVGGFTLNNQYKQQQYSLCVCLILMYDAAPVHA